MYSPETKKFLLDHGKDKVVSIQIVRTPISSGIHNFLDAIRDKSKTPIPYDKIFHLALIVNHKWMLEKIEHLHFGNIHRLTQETEYREIEINPIELWKIVEKAHKRQGDYNYFHYSAFDANCQDFVLNVLHPYLTPHLKEFVKQDTEEILKQLPKYSKIIANLITDIAGSKTPEPTYDPNPKHTLYLVQSIILNKSEFTKEEANYWIQSHHYKLTIPDETPNEYRYRQLDPSIIKTGHYYPKTISLGDKGYMVVLYK